MPGCCVQRWSLSLGRWWGISVYLHIFFLFSILLALAFSLADSQLLVAGTLTVVVLLVSVALHELAHAVAAIRVGGKVDAVVLGPVGGLISPRVPDEPEIHLFVALAGPIVHLLLAVVAAVSLAAVGNTELVGLLNPLATPRNLVEPGGAWLVAAKLTLWLNWILMLLNLLPVYPFDGGPVLRALLWPALGRRTARVVTARIAMGVAVALCAAAFFTVNNELPLRIFPAWIPIVVLAVFVFFSARQDIAAGEPQETAEQLAGYQINADGLDLLDAMWASDDDDEGVLVEHQQRASEQSEGSPEMSEDARVDDILARLYHSSWDALSPEEVAVLQRASQRYRQRRQSAGRR